jgi:hypothetical protein
MASAFIEFEYSATFLSGIQQAPKCKGWML